MTPHNPPNVGGNRGVNTHPISDDQSKRAHQSDAALIEQIAQAIIAMRAQALRQHDIKRLALLQEGDPHELARKILQGRKDSR